MKVKTLQKQSYAWADDLAIIGKTKPRGKKKRVVAMSDMQCGHVIGLTPLVYQLRERPEKTVRDHFNNKFARIEAECWDYYTKLCGILQPVDILIVNGDCIDGRGERSGGTELITADRDIQCDMAVDCIRQMKANHIVMTYGTPYHTGQLEDFESKIAESVCADKIGSHEWIDVYGTVFDIKHKVSSSIVPHGRATAPLRDALWSVLWATQDMIPEADILIRSHVHYCLDVKITGLPHVVILPALQAMGSKFGARQCSGIVDFGLAYFDVYENGEYDHKILKAKIESQKATVLKL